METFASPLRTMSREQTMITSNVLVRVRRFRYGNETGSSFLLEQDGKEYLVTARHLVKNIRSSDTAVIFHEDRWKQLDVNLVGLGDGDIDVAVLAPSIRQLPASYELPVQGDPKSVISLGQDVYFLGFPYGLRTDAPQLTGGFPLPLIKKGVISSMSDKGRYYLIDGHNNPGFSGGPVVYSVPDKRVGLKYFVAGVVSGFHYEWDSVYLNNQEVPKALKYNTGILIAYYIEQVTELIKSNPIGVEIAPAVSPSP